MKKLLLLSAFFIFTCSEDYEIICVDEVSLSSLLATNVTRTSATLNGVISTASINCDVVTTSNQGFVYSKGFRPSLNNDKVYLAGISINTTIENLEPNTTYYFRTFLINDIDTYYEERDLDDQVWFRGLRFTTHANDEPDNCDVVYLGENGITVKACESANVGSVGTVNGTEYTIVSEPSLRQMIEDNADISSVCTSKITSMKRLFFQNYVFDQDISSWDVSNVTSMSQMFEKSVFNQDISSWDLRNLTDMFAMFKDNSVFNQSLENWNVSSVTKMARMFEGNTAFNQPINNWNVGSVDEMWNMFLNASSFNQPLGNWNVSRVTNMYSMFSGSSFNQAIGSWNVSNVFDCGGFSYNTPQWTLPKPTFTNCLP